SGLFRPSDDVMSVWRRDLQAPTYNVYQRHITLREQFGFPAEASKNPLWAGGVSAESVSSYDTYISETIAWFGPLRPGNYLTETDFTQWCHQKGDFDGGYNPLDAASLALRRLQIHTDFQKSGEFNLRSFFIRQIKK
ncbi:MAG TPA: hypothetical protein VLA25_04080, partial [Methylotenera sp.]|nr:hypothetical protein [Methylotenera sp.]